MKYTFELCSGRHSTPATAAIFPNTVNPTDINGLYETAWRAIPADCDTLDVYVTGMTVAMLAVVNVCVARHVGLTAYHFDRESGEYYPQPVLRHWTCGFCGERNIGPVGYCSHCGAN